MVAMILSVDVMVGMGMAWCLKQNVLVNCLPPRINMLLQHYHTSTALSKKLDASFRYLQLQLGTPYNPLTLAFKKWGYLAPVLWVKMLWQSLDTFNIQLHMKYHTLPFP